MDGRRFSGKQFNRLRLLFPPDPGDFLGGKRARLGGPGGDVFLGRCGAGSLRVGLSLAGSLARGKRLFGEVFGAIHIIYGFGFCN